MSKEILNDRSVVIMLGQVLSIALLVYIASLFGAADGRFRNSAVAHAAQRSEGASESPTTANANTTSQSPGRKANLLAKVNARLSKDNRFRKIKASVSQPGVVILEGEVFDEEVKQLAAQRVRQVDGVKKVINALHISTLTWLQEQNRVTQILHDNGYQSVKAKVIGDTVFLSGEVHSEADKHKIEALIESDAPVKVGTNLIRVAPGSIF
jgi:osmotically-inducible protein OsmY